MGCFLQALEDLLPAHLHCALRWDFIPIKHIRDRHSDMDPMSLITLFKAYRFIEDRLDLETIASNEIPEDNWGCMRCGYCCTYMRPGPASASQYRKWKKMQSPAAWFFNSSGLRPKNPVYKCWYHEGVRLRICPFMLINLRDLRPFCSIYHLGDDFRPHECAGFIPRHETCTDEQPAVDPWEII